MTIIRSGASSRCLLSAVPRTCASTSISSFAQPRPDQQTSSPRPFSTTPALPRQTPSHLKVPKEQVPDYPYGPFRWYKQRNSGLYGTSKIQFGNTVSRKWMIKEPTHWKPNRHSKRFWSPALGAFIRTRVTANVLKTIDRLGGIDEYLLGTKQRRVRELGPAGWALRWKLMQSPVVQARWAAEREALGLPPKSTTTTTAGYPAGGADVLPSAEVMTELDAMLANEEEFVLGEETIEERFMEEEPQPRIEKEMEAAQTVLDGAQRKV